jgi:hypothetical protein
MKLAITQSEYLQLLGLKTLAIQHNKSLQDIDKAIAGILEVPNEGTNSPYFGHVSDCVYDNNESIDALLERLAVIVTDEATKADAA